MSITKIINQLMENYETSELEAKDSSNELSKDLWKTYSAFANTSGGIILLGVSQHKITHKFSITGVKSAEKLVAEIYTIAQNKNKVSLNLLDNQDVQIHNINGTKIISIYVREATISQKPIFLNGEDNYKQVYIRKYESDCRATPEEYRRFIRNAQDNTDDQLLSNYTIEDLDTSSILEFKNILHTRVPSKNYLQKENMDFLTEMGVFQIDRDDHRKLKLTLAGLLFLGKYDAIIQKLPHFHLEYLNKRCDSSMRWKDRVSTGDLDYDNLNLFQFYKIVLEKLKTTIDEPFELDERCVRKSPTELYVALREALGNVIIHADYLDSDSNILITVEPLFYSFENPGTMKISKEQFFTGGKSNPRNNILITFFRRMGASERAGSGGKEIFNVVEKNNFRAPELEVTLESTSLKLWCAAPENSYEEYDEKTKPVLFYIKENFCAKLKDLRDNTNLSDHHIHKAIKILLENEIIYVIGKGKATTYYWNPTALERVARAKFLSNMVLGK